MMPIARAPNVRALRYSNWHPPESYGPRQWSMGYQRPPKVDIGKPRQITLAFVSNSFIFSPQAFHSGESRSSINERGWNMAQFALGDVVRKNNGGDGVVRAIFTTNDGELTYVVEKDGVLDFVDEAKLSRQPEPDLAAYH